MHLASSLFGNTWSCLTPTSHHEPRLTPNPDLLYLNLQTHLSPEPSAETDHLNLHAVGPEPRRKGVGRTQPSILKCQLAQSWRCAAEWGQP